MADEEDEVGEEQQQEIGAAGAESDVAVSPVFEQTLAPPLYEVRPGLGDKFQAANVKEIIQSTMQEQLTGRQYRADQAPRWSKMIANGVRQRVQELGMKRYKILVQATVLELKGAGIKCGQRCIWDPETDDYIDDSFKNESLFCYTICYGVYMY